MIFKFMTTSCVYPFYFAVYYYIPLWGRGEGVVGIGIILNVTVMQFSIVLHQWPIAIYYSISLCKLTVSVSWPVYVHVIL